MNRVSESGWREVASALLRSYVADLRGWAAKLAAGYAVAGALMVGGILALFAAVAVGLTALFHLVERHYGTYLAYGGIGGGLLVVAIVLLVIGSALLRRQTAPLPRLHRQVQAANQMIFGLRRCAVGRFLQGDVPKADPVTGLLVGAAATMLLTWFFTSRLQSSTRGDSVRR